jgi:hypothetical protein
VERWWWRSTWFTLLAVTMKLSPITCCYFVCLHWLGQIQFGDVCKQIEANSIDCLVVNCNLKIINYNQIFLFPFFLVDSAKVPTWESVHGSLDSLLAEDLIGRKRTWRNDLLGFTYHICKYDILYWVSIHLKSTCLFRLKLQVINLWIHFL